MGYQRQNYKKRSPIAKDLQSRQYQPKTIPDKRKKVKHEEIDYGNDYGLVDTVSDDGWPISGTDPT